MKKPTVLLAASHEGMRVSYLTILSSDFNIIAREIIPEVDNFIYKRVDLIVILNLWRLYPEFLINDLAETLKIPVTVLVDPGNTSLDSFARTSQYLTVITNPVTNKQFITLLRKTLSESERDSVISPVEKKTRQDNKLSRSPVFRLKIEKVIDYIHSNYAVITSFRDVADEFDLNYKSMKTAIEKKTRLSPKELLREIRLEKLIQLIQFTQLGIDELLIETGFRDLKYANEQFYRKFKINIEECMAEFRIT